MQDYTVTCTCGFEYKIQVVDGRGKGVLDEASWRQLCNRRAVMASNGVPLRPLNCPKLSSLARAAGAAYTQQNRR